MLYSNIYLPFCVQTLKQLLDREKHLTMRQVQPRVRLITKQVLGTTGRQEQQESRHDRNSVVQVPLDQRPPGESLNLVLGRGGSSFYYFILLKFTELIHFIDPEFLNHSLKFDDDEHLQRTVTPPPHTLQPSYY